MKPAHSEFSVLSYPANTTVLTDAALLLAYAIYEVAARPVPLHTVIQFRRKLSALLLQAADPYHTYQSVCIALLIAGNEIKGNELLTERVLVPLKRNCSGSIICNSKRLAAMALAEAVAGWLDVPAAIAGSASSAQWLRERGAYRLLNIHSCCLRAAAYYLQLNNNMMHIGTGITIICVKDIMRITGKSRRTAQRLHKAIKNKHEKGRAGFVTVDEFSNYTGITPERIWYILR